ncbi:MAG: 3-methyl-2-oxobutanoate hydroxymethyltransferase [Gammaproteobacteria bacterium]|nr:3-methyl-2-oxobutanoate hydroxymethyltransferase [Gammaproteobacteria bacterium]
MSTYSDKPLTAVTLNTLAKMKKSGEKIACLTAYDATFTAVLEAADIEVILVGDSLGMVIQGVATTLPVTVDEMIYHCRCVARARKRALLIADMPFMSYSSPAQALENAARLMKEGGAQMVKLEGGGDQSEVVRALARNGIPVCAHLGLRPQSFYKMGGYRVQGRDAAAAQSIVDDAQALQLAGADLLLLECVTTAVAETVVATTEVPVIGIGAASSCAGQVLVLHDILGITPGKRPRFCKDFMLGADSIQGAVERYVAAVKSGAFPAAEHTFCT